ncbi:MAG TPA: bifunctional adenosylcobinamide kinase/adenosylcobinamide-phosphate guanylyltransferase [Acidimicrobiales bacterium]|nr:bifunctional adenosylcobinamide kinase/adenosylcobinamide-phosphate guanylyltransferase [Acidimicrobiales bacterium]
MITLVLGGARSGKSALAERLALDLPEPVTYLATGVATDPEMTARIAAHQARRPAGWRTVEAGVDLVDVLALLTGSVVVDSLGAWVAGVPGFAVAPEGLCRVLQARSGDSVVVSDEVGLGVHPSSQAGRWFRDALGELNQAVAAIADDVVLVVAGRVLHVDRA